MTLEPKSQNIWRKLAAAAGAGSSRMSERPNKRMQLTKPAQAMELRT
jgi:hypothetical protein